MVDLEVRRGQIQSVSDDAIVVGLFQGAKKPTGAAQAVDAACGGLVSTVLASGDFKGKLGETAVLYPQGRFAATRILLVGLGPQDKFEADAARRAAGRAASRLVASGVTSFATAIHGSGLSGTDSEELSQAVVEGTLLAAYKFKRYKSPPEDGAPETELRRVVLVEAEGNRMAAVRRGAKAGEIIATAVVLARDIANESGRLAAARVIADRVAMMAKETGIRCTVYDKRGIEKLGFNGLLAVNQGSAEEPRFVVLDYNPAAKDCIVIVGKGITFDSGGISLKPGENMEKMKHDKSGAAAVFGAVKAAAELGVKMRVVALAPLTDNLPSGTALKPGDIVKSHNGKTIEVVNTDAEGRIILADALSFAKEYKPKAVIDVATLTGACVVALGNHATGMMGTDRKLLERVRNAGEACHERVWELPFYEEYDKQLDSEVADVKNVGGREAGTITAGRFLAKFAGDYPWVHLDIAGTGWTERGSQFNSDYTPIGASGVGVRLLVQLLRDWSR